MMWAEVEPILHKSFGCVGFDTSYRSDRPDFWPIKSRALTAIPVLHDTDGTWAVGDACGEAVVLAETVGRLAAGGAFDVVRGPQAVRLSRMARATEERITR